MGCLRYLYFPMIDPDGLIQDWKMQTRIKNIPPFDAFVGINFSGWLALPIMRYHTRKHIIALRNEADESRRQIKGAYEDSFQDLRLNRKFFRWIFLDDCIAWGHTFTSVYAKMREHFPYSYFTGVYLYDKGGFQPRSLFTHHKEYREETEFFEFEQNARDILATNTITAGPLPPTLARLYLEHRRESVVQVEGVVREPWYNRP